MTNSNLHKVNDGYTEEDMLDLTIQHYTWANVKSVTRGERSDLFAKVTFDNGVELTITRTFTTNAQFEDRLSNLRGQSVVQQFPHDLENVSTWCNNFTRIEIAFTTTREFGHTQIGALPCLNFTASFVEEGVEIAKIVISSPGDNDFDFPMIVRTLTERVNQLSSFRLTSPTSGLFAS